jgi:hypothetical protein
MLAGWCAFVRLRSRNSITGCTPTAAPNPLVPCVPLSYVSLLLIQPRTARHGPVTVSLSFFFFTHHISCSQKIDAADVQVKMA